MDVKNSCKYNKKLETDILKEIYPVLNSIEGKYYQISFRIAHYFIRVSNDYVKAKEYIDEAFYLLNVQTDSYKLKKILLDKDFPILYTRYILNVKKEKVYELAGQIYAVLSKEKEEYQTSAIQYYQKYQTLLQQYKIPEYLEDKDSVIVYSFRGYNSYSLEDLINNTITVVRPSKMNDPFDSIANLWKKKDNLKDLTDDVGHESLLDSSMDYFRIRSFCANRQTFDSDDRILKKIKMWSLYADHHKGFCIKYRLKDKMFRDISSVNNHVLRLASVTYEEEQNIGKGKIGLDTYQAYFVKHKEWESEEEVRLLSYYTESDKDFYSEPMDNNAEIEEIVFGYSCTIEHMNTICNLFRAKGVENIFYKMTTKVENNIYESIKEKYTPK